MLDAGQRVGGDGYRYHFDQEIYAWRSQLPDGKSATLRISPHVLEHNPAFIVNYHLDRLSVARAIRAQPEARLVVAQKGVSVVLKEISS